MTGRGDAGESARRVQVAENEPGSAREDARSREFRSIYRREFGFVWAVARRFGVPPAAVDDAVQDVFLTAYRRLDQLRYEVSPRSWLYGVTRRVASRYRRGAWRRARRVAALAVVAPAPAAAPQDRHEAAQLLERLLARLGEGTRGVWEMTELLGMSGPEIAAELGLPVNTVYSRLRLARAQLQELGADPQGLAAGVAAQREIEAPPPEAERRTWAALVPVFGKGGAPVVAAVATTRVAVAATLIAVGGAVAGLTMPRARTGEVAARSASGEQAATRGRAPGAGAAADEVGHDMSRETGTFGSAERERGGRGLSSGTGTDRLAEEVALIDRARARLAARAPEEALALVEAHAREFPRGALVDAREAARAEALCGLGQAQAAHAAARRLLAEHPGSPVAQRFGEFRCSR